MLTSFKDFLMEAVYKSNKRYTIDADILGFFEVYADKDDEDSYQEIEFSIEAELTYFKPSPELRVQPGSVELSIDKSTIRFNENFTLGKEKFRKDQVVTDAFLKKHCETYKSIREMIRDLEDEIYLAAEKNL